MGLKPKDQEELIDFYAKTCKYLIWKMPTIKEKILTATWLNKIKFDTNVGCNVRCAYMTALMFMIAKRHLFGPFIHPPPNQFLPPLNDRYSLKNISLEYIKSKNSKDQKTVPGCQQEEKDALLYHTISSDTREYAAVQEIPNFGTQIYMATSIDPMETWPYVPSYLTEIEKIEYYHPCLEIMANMNDISCFIDPNIIDRQTKHFEAHDPNIQICNNNSADILKNGSVELTRAPTWGSNLLALNSDHLYKEDKEQKHENQETFLFDVFSKIEPDIKIDPVLVEKFFKNRRSKKTKSYDKFCDSESISNTRTKFSLNNNLRNAHKSKPSTDAGFYKSDYKTKIDYTSTDLQKQIISKLKNDHLNCNGDHVQNDGIGIKESTKFIFKSKIDKNWESNTNMYVGKKYKPKITHGIVPKKEIGAVSVISSDLPKRIHQDNLRSDYNRIIRSCLSKNSRIKAKEKQNSRHIMTRTMP